MGRGRGVTTRGGRGSPGVTRGRGQGRGRGVPKLSEEEEAQNKRLAEEMAATVRALSLAEADQLAQIVSHCLFDIQYYLFIYAVFHNKQ